MKRIKISFMQALCLFVLFMTIIKTVPAMAGSADIRLYSDSEEYHEGDSITIYIDIEADTLPGDFEGSLHFPKKLLKYVSDSPLATKEDGAILIYDHVMKEERTTRKYAFKFKAVGTGQATVSLKGPKREENGKYDEDPEIYELEEGYRMSISRNDLTISIVSEKVLSKDADLAVLRISPGVLIPEFSPDITEYLTEVTESTEKLAVSAAASDREAEVKVSGNDELQFGENKIEIEVTAPNGDKKKYYIYCKKYAKDDNIEDGREDGEHQETEVTSDPDRNSGGTGEVPKIQAVSSDEGTRLLLSNDFTVADTEGYDTPEGYKKTSLKIDGISIPVYVKENEDPDALILMLLYDKNGEKVLYDYDRKDKTLQRHAEAEEKEQTVKKVMTDSIEALELAASYEKSLSTLTLIIAGLCALTMALMIIVIRLAIKSRKDDLD